MKITIYQFRDDNSPFHGSIEIKANDGDALVEAVENLRLLGLLPTPLVDVVLDSSSAESVEANVVDIDELVERPRGRTITQCSNDLEIFVRRWVMEGEQTTAHEHLIGIAHEIAATLIRGEKLT